MAGDNPTATPQTTQTPAQPTQPQDTSAAAPTPASGTPNPATPNAAPAAPAQAPAGALPPSTSSGLHGILAHVALGALAGAATGIKKAASGAGKGYDNYINRTPYGQKVQAGRIELQQKQQELEAAKQKQQQDATKSLDEHQESVLRANGISLDNAHKVTENTHLEKMYPLVEGAEKATLMGQLATQNKEDRDVLSTLAEAGVSIDTAHGAGFSNLTPDHAKAVADGSQIMVSNGQTGADAGFGFISNQDLVSTILPHDVKVATDYIPDDKGNVTPVYTTLRGGQNNALDVLVAHDAGMKKFGQVQQMTKDKFANQQAQAATEKDVAESHAQNAAALLNEAYAKTMTGGANGVDSSPDLSAAIAQYPPDVQAELKKFDANTISDLIRGSVGKISPNTFPQRLTKGGLGILRSQAGGLMARMNPNYRDDLFDVVKDTDTKFTTGSQGDAIRSFNQFLVHGATLKQVSDNFARTNSPLINQPMNQLSSRLMGQPGVPEMVTAVEAARQEWQTFVDSGYKPDTEQSKRASILMSDESSPAAIAGVLGIMGDQAIGRLDQLNESYRTATGMDYPNLITPSGRDAANALGLGGQVAKYQSGGSYSGGAGKTAPQAPPPGTTHIAPGTGANAGHNYYVNAQGQVLGQKD